MNRVQVKEFEDFKARVVELEHKVAELSARPIPDDIGADAKAHREKFPRRSTNLAAPA